MSPKSPTYDDAAYEAAFIGVCSRVREVFELARNVCMRRTPAEGLLSTWERLAVWLYCTTAGPWFNVINAPLRRREQPDRSVAIVIECLESALRKLPAHEGYVYRGISIEDLPTFLHDYALDFEGKGTPVVWHAFSSSSLDPSQAIVGNVLFIIESNDGRRVGHYADLWEEQEVVFLPGSQFRIEGLELMTSKAIINLKQIAPLGSDQ